MDSNWQIFEKQESGNILSLAKDIRLRREYFGGLAFNSGNGDIVELDKEAFALLSLLESGSIHQNKLNHFLLKNKPLQTTHDDFKHVLSSLEQAGLICRRNHSDRDIFREPAENSSYLNSILKNPPRQWLSAPETVHWAVTYRCGQDCPECYTRRFNPDQNELTVDNALKVIDKLAGWGIFQLAIGGGEPFEKEGLYEIVTHAARSGLAVHLTTGLKNLESNDISQYSGKIKNLQIGLPCSELTKSTFTDLIGSLENTISLLKDTGISPGVNIVLSKQVIIKLEEILVNIISTGCNRVILVRYKPPDSGKLWRREKPDREQLLHLHNNLVSIRKKYPEPELRTDCALSFLQRFVPENLAKQIGYKGCVAADRIMAVSPSGDMYPCSQLVSPQMKAGNMITDDPQDVWDHSGIMKKYRYFRNSRNIRDSWCGICKQKDICGGCRVFAHDATGGDPGCPQPLPPPLKKLGKYGRRIDIREYLEKNGAVTAREYMERYGVGEKKALKELNSITGSANRNPRFGYAIPAYDIISDIQDSIGYTSGGVPFASYEEIVDWLEDEPDDYPNWILNHKLNT